MSYAVIVSSKTGNTQRLADRARAELGEKNEVAAGVSGPAGSSRPSTSIDTSAHVESLLYTPERVFPAFPHGLYRVLYTHAFPVMESRICMRRS